MMLIEETPVPDTALPVDAFKAHLRLGSGFGQDDVQDGVVRSFLRAAMAAIEARTGKALITRTFGWTLTFWRDGDAQRLPVAPVVAITRVALVSRSGVETDVDAASFWLEQDAMRPRLRATGSALPRIPKSGSVSITFDAGFGSSWDAVPADLRQAVLMLAAHYYDHRDDMTSGERTVPFGVSSLIERFKTVRMGFGQ
ncbi:MAG: head-tail connector protein [Sulfitobacter sp.]